MRAAENEQNVLACEWVANQSLVPIRSLKSVAEKQTVKRSLLGSILWCYPVGTKIEQQIRELRQTDQFLQELCPELYTPNI